MSELRRTVVAGCVACLLLLVPSSAFAQAEDEVDTLATQPTAGLSGERVAGIAGALFLAFAAFQRGERRPS